LYGVLLVVGISALTDLYPLTMGFGVMQRKLHTGLFVCLFVRFIEGLVDWLIDWLIG